MLVFGTRLFGKVEVVPGVCHVATRFFHLNFVPLLPTSSWVVLDGTQRSGLMSSSWKGFELSGLRWSSVLMGWLRLGLAVVLAAFLFMGLADLRLAPEKGGLLLLLAAGCGVAFWYSYRLARATPESLRTLVQDRNFPAELARVARSAIGEGSVGRP